MKRIVSLMGAVLVLVSGFAQGGDRVIALSTDRTTSLIFPFAVKFVDRGSKEVLVQQVKEAENLLLVKAGVASFKSTNLQVVTADGSLYAFEVVFDSLPVCTVYRLESAAGSTMQLSGGEMDATSMQACAKAIAVNTPFIRGVQDESWAVKARLNGIYISGDLMFLQWSLDNTSPLRYDIDYIRLSVRDRKRSKRTASQEITMVPVYKAGNTERVGAFNRNVLVFALPAFTLAPRKYLLMEIGEKHGGRQLRLKIDSRKLVQARLLPALR